MVPPMLFTSNPNSRVSSARASELFCPLLIPMSSTMERWVLMPLSICPIPSAKLANSVREWLLALPGVTEVHDRAAAALKLELPPDRLGEFVVLSGRDVVLGRTPEYHDLNVLKNGLRSHGGRYEEMVPFIVSEPLRPEHAAKASCDPRNFDIFDFTINGTQHP